MIMSMTLRGKMLFVRLGSYKMVSWCAVMTTHQIPDFGARGSIRKSSTGLHDINWREWCRTQIAEDNMTTVRGQALFLLRIAARVLCSQIDKDGALSRLAGLGRADVQAHMR